MHSNGECLENDQQQLSTIRQQLENLNNATVDINSYELKLDMVRKQFRETQAAFNSEQAAISRKLGRHISKARPFFDLKSKESELRKNAQKAAEVFERKKTIATMTKDQLTVLHESLHRNQDLDAENQYIDVIEQQLELVREADEECIEAEKIHAQRIKELMTNEQMMKKIMTENGSSVRKSRSYYERRESMTRILKSQLELIDFLENEIQRNKDCYSTSMKNLEMISEQIHLERSMMTENSENRTAGSVFGSSSETEDDAKSDLP